MKLIIYLFLLACAVPAVAQEIVFQKQKFEINAVKAEVTKLNGEQVLKVERDLNVIPFDMEKLGSTVDEPTYVKLKDLDFENGTIEVKMYSQIQNPSPFPGSQGFIGVAFRINDDNTAFESIYLRPRVGRSNNQNARNHTVQYYAYPDFKFDRLRKESPGMYETTAPVDINEWITMRIEVAGEKAHMFINDAKYSTFVVEKMKGKTTHGAIALWVDIGTIGYFKDLKITKK
ncbi:MAG: DUF1080 domain-containing protein [Cyclobacteriaceae bacterium]|nr:MAG: DUF1080 domain-containing protein [Cyclobacteriaceae bacterium]